MPFQYLQVKKQPHWLKQLRPELQNRKLAEKKIKSDDTTLLKKFEYENERRYNLSERSAGSIYKVKLDDTHPYAFGTGQRMVYHET